MILPGGTLAALNDRETIIGGVVIFVAGQARKTLGDEVNQALKEPTSSGPSPI